MMQPSSVDTIYEEDPGSWLVQYPSKEPLPPGSYAILAFREPLPWNSMAPWSAAKTSHKR